MMENSALNKAHQQHRRADAHLRHKRFLDAIECHKKASELLDTALSLTQNPRSLESIKLQRNYHLRQIDIILIKKEQFENYQMAVEHKHFNSICADDLKDVQDDNKSLQVAIYRNMEEADSLLGLLMKKGSNMNSDSESIKSFSTTDTDDKPISIDTLDSSNSNCPIGTKHPKDQNTVIEELKVLNEQLHLLVYRLVTQLDASAKENNLLKERIKQLENDKLKAVNAKSSSNNLRVITDSSGGTSPFVFSPNSELSPDMHDRTLPPLAPLDLPNFEFPGFVKNNSHVVNTGRATTSPPIHTEPEHQSPKIAPEALALENVSAMMKMTAASPVETIAYLM